MNKILLHVTFLSVFYFLGVSAALAQHNTGAYLSYSSLSPSSVEVTLELTRVCTGASFPATTTVTANRSITLIAACIGRGNFTHTLTLSSSSPSENPMCNSLYSCSLSNLNLETAIYKGTVSVPPTILSLFCSRMVEISYDGGSRVDYSPVASTIVNGQNISTRIIIDDISVSNHSPTFSSPLHINARFDVAGNDTTRYSQERRFDLDGDSVVYKLVNAERSKGMGVNYVGPYSATNLINNDYLLLNPQTGQLDFNATAAVSGPVAILVQEYRGGVLLNTSRRDIAIFSENTSNNYPELTGFHNQRNNFETTIYEGSSVQLELGAWDLDASDVIDVKANNLPPTAMITYTPKTGNPNQGIAVIDWSPNSTQLGRHEFTVSVRDNNCPIRGEKSYTYTINVARPPAVTCGGIDYTDLVCEGNSIVVEDTANIVSTISDWELVSLRTGERWFNSTAGGFDIDSTQSHVHTGGYQLIINPIAGFPIVCPLDIQVVKPQKRVQPPVSGFGVNSTPSSGWTNVSNLQTANPTAYFDNNVSNEHTLVFSNILPAGAIVLGLEPTIRLNLGGSSTPVEVQVEVEKKGSGGLFTADTSYRKIIVGTNVRTEYFGHPNELWGSDWNSTDIANGIRVKISSNPIAGSFGTTRVDYAQLLVYYTLPVDIGFNGTVDITRPNDSVFSVIGLPETNRGNGGLGVYSASTIPNNAFVEDTLRTLFAPSGNHLISYTTIDNNGCIEKDTASIRIKSSPVLSCLQLPNTVTVCQYGLLSIRDDNPGAISWDWQDPLGTTISTDTTLEIYDVRPADAGTYTVVLTDAVSNTLTCSVVVDIEQASIAGAATPYYYPSNENGDWDDADGVYTSDHAKEKDNGKAHEWEDILPSGLNVNDIVGIELLLNGATHDNGFPTVGVLAEISGDDGTTFAPNTQTAYWSGAKHVYENRTLGGCNDLWGYTSAQWASFLSAGPRGNFVVKLTKIGDNNKRLDLDDLTVRVHYAAAPIGATFTMPRDTIVEGDVLGLVPDSILGVLPRPAAYFRALSLPIELSGDTIYSTVGNAGNHLIEYGENGTCGGACFVPFHSRILTILPAFTCDNVPNVVEVCENDSIKLLENNPSSTSWLWQDATSSNRGTTRQVNIFPARTTDAGTYQVSISNGIANAVCPVEVIVNTAVGAVDSAAFSGLTPIGVGWSNPIGVNTVDGVYTSVISPNTAQVWSGFNAGALAGNPDITGIEILVTGKSVSPAIQFQLEISKDGGLNYSTAVVTRAFAMPNIDEVVTFGGVSDLWGESAGYFTAADFNTGGSFQLRITRLGGSAGDSLSIDNVVTKVFYSQPTSFSLPTTYVPQGDTLILSTLNPQPLLGEFRSYSKEIVIKEDTLFPATTSVGLHDIIYGFEDKNGCFAGVSQTVRIMPRNGPLCSGVPTNVTVCTNEDLVITDTRTGNTAWDWKDVRDSSYSSSSTATVSNPDPTLYHGVHTVEVTNGGTLDTCTIYVEVLQPQYAPDRDSTAVTRPGQVNGFWSSINNAIMNSNAYASVAGPGMFTLDLFDIGSPNLGIPTSAVITGIKVNIEGNTSSLNTGVKVRVGGIPPSLSPNTYTRIYPNTGSDQILSFGGPNDLWGRTWTVAEVNNNLRVDIRNVCPTSADFMYVDDVTVQVFYKVPTVTAGVSSGIINATIPDTIVLSQSPNAPVPAYSMGTGEYRSATGQVAISNDSFFTALVAPNSTHTVTYGIYDDKGCYDDGGSSFQIEARPAAGGLCGRVTELASVCIGDALSILDSATTTNNYIWERPLGTSMGVGNVSSYSVSSAGASDEGTYYLIITDGALSDTCEIRALVNKPSARQDSVLSTSGFTFVGTTWWDPNTNFARTSNGLYATTIGGANSTMIIKNFNLNAASIPNDAVIQGIEVIIEAYPAGSFASNPPRIDIDMRFGGTSPAPGPISGRRSDWWWERGVEETKIFGSPNDLWGASVITKNELDNDLQIEVTVNNNGGTVAMDVIRLKVYYNEPPTTGIFSPSLYYQPTVITLTDSMPMPIGGTYSSSLAPTALSSNTFFNTGGLSPNVYDLNYSVIDFNGCTDATTTQLLVRPARTVTCGSIPDTITVCERDTFFLQDNQSVRQWTITNIATSATKTITSLTDFVRSNINPGNAGLYSVFKEGIDATDTITCYVYLKVNLAPARPIIYLDNDEVCERLSNKIYTDNIPGITTFWRAPDGTNYITDTINFTFSVKSDSGTYFASNEDIATGCRSLGNVRDIDVKSRPPRPVLSNVQVCEGQDIVLTANTTIVPDSIIWRFDGLHDTVTYGIDTVLTIAAGNPIFYNSGQWQARSFINGCGINSTPAFVLVKPAPIANIATAPSVLCYDQNADYTASDVGSGASYDWYSIGATPTLLGSGRTLTLANLQQDTAVVLVVTKNGCIATNQDTAYTTVSPAPYRPDVINDTVDVCIGSDALVGTTLTGATSYTWRLGATLISTSRTFTVLNANVSNEGRYDLQVIDSFGCPLLDTFVYVQVNSVPSPPTILNATSFVCEGDDIILEAATIAGLTYEWTAPNNTILTGSNITIASNAPEYLSGVWTVTAISPLTNCRASSDINVSIELQGITPIVFAYNSTACQGDDIQVTTSMLPNVVAYNWYDNLGNKVDSVRNPLFKNVQNATTYYLEVTTLGGCTYTRDSLDLFPINSNLPNDLFQTDSLLICADGTPITFGLVPIASTSLRYTFTRPNGTTQVGTDPNIVLFTNANQNAVGNYELIVEDTASNCTRTDSIYVGVRLGAVPNGQITVSGNCVGDNFGAQYTTAVALPTTVNYTWTLLAGATIQATIVTTTDDLALQLGDLYYNDAVNSTDILLTITDTVSGCAVPYPVGVSLANVLRPAPLTPSVSNDGPTCFGSNVQLDVVPVAGSSYEWFADSNRTITVGIGNSISVGGITTDSTFYVVETNSNGCTADTSTLVAVINNTTVTPAVFADSTCVGGTINVYTTTSGSQYEWTHNNSSFTNNDSSFVIPNATLADTGFYNLSMQDTNGCILNTVSVNVVVSPLPTAPTVTGQTIICIGRNIDLVATGCPNVQWIDEVSNVVLGTNATLTITPTDIFYQAERTRIRLQCTSLNNCSIDTVITVVYRPKVGVALTGDSLVCYGGNATVNSNRTQPVRWYADSTLTNFISNSQSITLSNLTNDTAIYYLAGGQGFCLSDTLGFNIRVNPLIAKPIITADSTVCEGAPIRLTTTATGAISYNWSGPNGFTSNQQNPLLNNVQAADTGQYMLVIRDSLGCISDSATMILSMDTLPTAPTTDGGNFICQGDTLFLVAQGTAGCDSTQWIGPAGTSVPTGDSIAILPTDLANYRSGLWRLTCIDTTTNCPSYSNNKLVVIANPVTAPQVALITASVCRGGSAEVAVTNAQANQTYHWYPDANLDIPIAIGPNPTIAGIDKDTTLYVVAISNRGCQSLPTILTIQPVIKPAPSVPATFATCEGQNVTVNYTGSPGMRYCWSHSSNGSVTYDSTFRISNVSTADAGTYTFSMTDTFGCRLADTSFLLIVDTLPAEPIIVGDSMYCQGEDILLVGTNMTPIVDSIFWGNGTGNIFSNNDTLIIVPSNTGYGNSNWRVRVKDANGCINTSDFFAVAVNPIPMVTATSDGPYCGSSATATFSTRSVQTGANYTWYDRFGNPLGTGNSYVDIITDTTTVIVGSEILGCEGFDTITVLLNAPPILGLLSSSDTICAGENITIGTTTFGSRYEWTGPAGFVTYDSVFTITNADPLIDAGIYTLNYMNLAGCSSSTTYRLVINNTPAVPTITGATTYCDGIPVVLTANNVVGNNLLWNNGTTSPFPNTTTLTIPTTDPSYVNNNNWTLISFNSDNCVATSAPFTVTIHTLPTVVLDNDGPYCGANTATFEPRTVQTGATYRWYTQNSSLPIMTADSFVIANLATDTTMIVEIQDMNGCTARDTSTAQVVLPAAPVVTSFGVPCAGNDFVLQTPTYGLNYQWTTPTGLITYDSVLTVANFGVLDTGAYTLNFVDSNGCRAMLTTVNVGIQAAPLAATIQGDTFICAGDSIVLTHNAASNYNTRWVTNGNSFSVDTLIVLPSNSSYNNTFWTLEVEDATTGCTNNTTIQIGRRAAPIVLVSNNGPICAGSDAIFNASNIPNASYTWFDTDTTGLILGGGANLTLPELDQMQVVALQVAVGNCIAYATDSIEIAQNAGSIMAQNDTVNVIAGSSSTIVNVIDNDSLGGAWSINMLTLPSQANAINLNNGNFDIDMTDVNTNDELTYIVCNPSCVSSCDTAVLFIHVSTLGDCMIPNIFTPNGDGVNDVFEIPCLTGMGNHLWIFNRWGDLIYETDNYQNNWSGKHNGVDVADGTYFYILQTNSGEEKQSSIEVRR